MTHNKHIRQTSMTSVGLELMIPATEFPKTYILDNTVTRTWVTPNQ